MNNENIENNGDTIVSTKNNAKYRETDNTTSVPSISLTDDQTIVDLDGYHVTVGDLKEHVIDSHQYRQYIRELRDKAEMEVE